MVSVLVTLVWVAWRVWFLGVLSYAWFEFGLAMVGCFGLHGCGLWYFGYCGFSGLCVGIIHLLGFVDWLLVDNWWPWCGFGGFLSFLGF